MGKRSRKRGHREGTAGESSAATTTRAERDAARERRAMAQAASGGRHTRRSRPGRPSPDERPPAPWGNFPLVELVVLGAIGLFVAGLIVRGERGGIMLICALVLGSLAGLELSIREHFAGFRSHTTLLAGAAGVAAGMLSFFLLGKHTGRIAFLPAGIVVFLVAYWPLRQAFKRRSGGLGFRA